MSKVFKYLLIFLSGIILLIATLLVYTQTASFREKAKIQLIKIVENQLDLNLEIEKIDGNIFQNITFQNIKLSKKDTTVAAFSTLQLNYNLLQLTKKIIDIDSVLIENPHINIWQNYDSTWNFKHFVKTAKTEIVQESKPFDYKINVNCLSVKNGNISTLSFLKIIPTETNNFNLLAAGSYSKIHQTIQLKKLDFKTENPSLVINKLSGIFTQNSTGIQLDSLLLITQGSEMELNGKYSSKANLNSNIEASKVDKNEISIFLPSLKLKCSPALKVSFKTENDSVSALVKLQNLNQSLTAEISLNPFTNFLNKTEPIPYQANLNFYQFKVEDWIEIKKNHVLIDGKIKIDGSNLFNYESRAKIFADLNNSEYNQIEFHTLLLNGIYSDNGLNAKLNVSSDYGNLQIDGKLWNVSTIPRYNALIETSDFNVSAFFPILEGSRINGKVKANGRGFELNNMETQAHLNFHNSLIYNYPVDTLEAELLLNKMLLNIDSMQARVPGVFAKAKGYFNLDAMRLNALIDADIDSLTLIDSIVELPLTFESAKTRTTLSGPITNLQIGGDFEVHNAEGYSVNLESAIAKYKVSIEKNSINLWMKTTATAVETGPSVWDTVKVEMNYSDLATDLDVNAIWNDTINAKITTQITMGDTLTFVVPDFNVKTLLSEYYLVDTTTVTLLKQDIFEIGNLHLRDRNHPDFILSLDGILATSDTNHFELLVNQLDLAQLNRFIQQPDSLKGVLTTAILMNGTSANPTIEGSLEIKNPEFGTYSLSSLSSNFNFRNRKGFADIKTPDMAEFYASVSAPFSAYLDSLEFKFTPPKSFNANLLIDSLQISEKLRTMIPNDSISGLVNANINATGGFDNPLVFGELDIINANYQNKKLGVNYNQIKASALFEGKKIILDTILVKQKTGLISMTGEVEFDSTIITGNIISSSLTADAKNFYIAQHRNYEVLIDAKTFIKTESDKPEFGGKIKVVRSDIFLPAFLSNGKEMKENDIPMLVDAVYSKPDSLLLKTKTEKDQSKSEKMQAKIFDNLTGKLNVEIPRNTWIKSDDMRIELRGSLDIVKTGTYFELFGTIDIVRGQYILYGKKLKIKESQIIFQGGEKFDPNLNFIAEYIYRGSDKQKRYLELTVNGKISEPEISFLLDGNEITETDGVSILIFGATSDELGYSGQNGLVSSVGSKAVASVITSKLSKTLGTQLKLDMVEVTATENWQSAAFMVGKYITNDIFVMYERGFGEVNGDEITPETITLEYELNEIIFLRLQSGSSTTSGIDVILKFEQKK